MAHKNRDINAFLGLKTGFNKMAHKNRDLNAFSGLKTGFNKKKI